MSFSLLQAILQFAEETGDTGEAFVTTTFGTIIAAQIATDRLQ